MKVNNLEKCFISQTQTFVCAKSSSILITLCQPYYHQRSLWASSLDDSVLTIVLQPIILLILGPELQLTIGSSLESRNCWLTSYVTSPLCSISFPPSNFQHFLYPPGYNCPSFTSSFLSLSFHRYIAYLLSLYLFLLPISITAVSFSLSSFTSFFNLSCTVKSAENLLTQSHHEII